MPIIDAHQGEAEVQAGDGPATEPQEEGEGHGEEEEEHGHTHFEGAIEEGGVNEELLSVTPAFPKKTKCKPICMPGSSFMHIVT
jgi:hypothetical protein